MNFNYPKEWCMTEIKGRGGEVRATSPDIHAEAYIIKNKLMENNYTCETCRDTHWYGDNGPGISGNTEYQLCDCVAKPIGFDNFIKAAEEEILRLGQLALGWKSVAKNMSLELHDGKELSSGYLWHAYGTNKCLNYLKIDIE